jgi:hypothetical protein
MVAAPDKLRLYFRRVSATNLMCRSRRNPLGLCGPTQIPMRPRAPDLGRIARG